MNQRRPTMARRLLTLAVMMPVMAAVAIVNRPIVSFAADRYHEFNINRLSYKQQFGHWSLLTPEGQPAAK